MIRGDLVVGDTISIIEPYFIEENTLFTWANYMPSLPYHEYFFFLCYQLGEYRDSGSPRPESYVGAFPVLHGEFGRFRVPEVGMARNDAIFSIQELSLGTHADTDLYDYLFQEVITAYMDWNRPAVRLEI